MREMTIATLNLWGTTGPWRERMRIAASEMQRHGVEVLLAQESSMASEYLAELLAMRILHGPTESPGFGLAILYGGHVDREQCVTLPASAGEHRQLLSCRLAKTNTWLHCTHLSHRLEEGELRAQQIACIESTLRELDEHGLHILGGDMNADPDSAEMRLLIGAGEGGSTGPSMQDAWSRHSAIGDEGFTWCMQSGEARLARSIAYDRRLDYLLVSPQSEQGAGTILASGRVCEDSDAQGLHASDHCGVWARVELGDKGRARRRQRLLVIDDDEGIRVTIEAALEEHDVVSVESADKAKELLASGGFDVVFCDLMMPGLTGAELFDALDGCSAYRRRFVFISGGNLPSNVRAFVEEEDRSILRKPFSISSLRESVERILRERAS